MEENLFSKPEMNLKKTQSNESGENEKVINFKDLFAKNSLNSSLKLNENIRNDHNKLLQDLIKNNNIKLDSYNNKDNNHLNRLIINNQMQQSIFDKEVLLDEIIKKNLLALNSNHLNLNNLNCNSSTNNMINRNFSPLVNMNNSLLNNLISYYNTTSSPSSDQMRFYTNMIYSSLQNLSQFDPVLNSGNQTPNAIFMSISL